MDKKFSIDKICNKCNSVKSISDFHKDKSKSDGYKNYCKLCQKAYSSKFYSENRDKIISYSIKYQKEHLEDSKAKSKVRSKNWIKANKEKKREYDKNYNILNREKIKSIKRRNSEKINSRRRKTRSENPLIRLKNNIRTSIYISMKRKGYTKRSNTYKILGINYNEFLSYIESKFEPWMNWNNYGIYTGELNTGWDIDHIIPVSIAKSEEDIVKLNHYLNFQPLCSKINRDIKKNNLIYG